MACGVGTTAHGYGTIRFLHGKDVVYAVAGHSHLEPAVLQGLYQLLLLLWLYAAKHGVDAYRVGNLLRRVERGGVHKPIGPLNAGLGCDLRDGKRVVARDDLYRNSLVRKLGKGGRGVVTNGVGDGHKEQRSCIACVVLRRQLRKDQHAHALPCARLHGLAVLFERLRRQHELRRTKAIGFVVHHNLRVLELGGKRRYIGVLKPGCRACVLAQGQHGGVVVWHGGNVVAK